MDLSNTPPQIQAVDIPTVEPTDRVDQVHRWRKVAAGVLLTMAGLGFGIAIGTRVGRTLASALEPDCTRRASDNWCGFWEDILSFLVGVVAGLVTWFYASRTVARLLLPHKVASQVFARSTFVVIGLVIGWLVLKEVLS